MSNNNYLLSAACYLFEGIDIPYFFFIIIFFILLLTAIPGFWVVSHNLMVFLSGTYYADKKSRDYVELNFYNHRILRSIFC